MKNQTEEGRFARLYLWAAKAKLTMGLFFVAFAVIYLFLGLVAVPSAVTLGFWTALQMLIACGLIGLGQKLLLGETLSNTRHALWVGGGTLVTLALSLAFGWFAAFPAWCLPLFIVFTFIALVMMSISLELELRRETRRLNERLGEYQARRRQTPAGE